MFEKLDSVFTLAFEIAWIAILDIIREITIRQLSVKEINNKLETDKAAIW